MNLSRVARQPAAVWHSYVDSSGGRLFRFFLLLRELGAFAMIVLGVIVAKSGLAKGLIHPLIRHHVYEAGARLLPMIGFIGAALGLVIVSQTVALLTQVGAQAYIGTVMVTVLIRELGPLLTALVVLARSGTANAVELGTARALGEVEALESLGIDPVHYLVVPRVVGLAVSVFCLATYLVLVSLASGWLFTFLQHVPLSPGAYFTQLAGSLHARDFVFFTAKTMAFGVVIAVVSSYHGLARALTIDEVAGMTTRAVVQTVAACVLVDALFLLGYLVG